MSIKKSAELISAFYRFWFASNGAKTLLRYGLDAAQLSARQCITKPRASLHFLRSSVCSAESGCLEGKYLFSFDTVVGDVTVTDEVVVGVVVEFAPGEEMSTRPEAPELPP